MTCEVQLRDERTVARIINLAHRFGCRCTRIAAQAGSDGTSASFAFDGPTIALSRLQAQIDRIVGYESFAAASPEGT